MEQTVKMNASSETATEQESFKVVEWNVRPNDTRNGPAAELDNSCGCDCGCHEMA